MDAVDTNVPSPESLIRQTLYGNGFFRRELGVTSRDVFLPDCFGFGFALPSVAAHSGLFAFSTQKLTWGSSVRIPFDVGLWEGVDGSTLIAALNPGDYASEVKGDLTLDADIYAVIDRQSSAVGPPRGRPLLRDGRRRDGAGRIVRREPREEPPRAGAAPRPPRPPPTSWRATSSRGSAGKGVAGLPRYRGEFLLTSHGAGCYTSQAAMKSFNRANQRLAAAAEGAAVAASWLGGARLPARDAPRGVDPLPLAPVPRRPDGDEHPRGVRLLLERRGDRR